MRSCKFCGIAEGNPDRRGDPAHINRDNLCAPCYYVLERIKYQPGSLSEEQQEWFREMCEFNMVHGMFVPVAQRRELKHLKPWQCKGCNKRCMPTLLEYVQDPHYVNYCKECATARRKKRDMRKARKTRSDMRKVIKM